MTLDAPTVISSLLALGILGALVMLVRSMIINAETEISRDYLFSGTPVEAAQSISQVLDGIKGVELRPATRTTSFSYVGSSPRGATCSCSCSWGPSPASSCRSRVDRTSPTART